MTFFYLQVAFGLAGSLRWDMHGYAGNGNCRDDLRYLKLAAFLSQLGGVKKAFLGDGLRRALLAKCLSERLNSSLHIAQFGQPKQRCTLFACLACAFLKNSPSMSCGRISEVIVYEHQMSFSRQITMLLANDHSFPRDPVVPSQVQHLDPPGTHPSPTEPEKVRRDP